MGHNVYKVQFPTRNDLDRLKVFGLCRVYEYIIRKINITTTLYTYLHAYDIIINWWIMPDVL